MFGGGSIETGVAELPLKASVTLMQGLNLTSVLPISCGPVLAAQYLWLVCFVFAAPGTGDPPRTG
jgi:hypothetical protein